MGDNSDVDADRSRASSGDCRHVRQRRTLEEEWATAELVNRRQVCETTFLLTQSGLYVVRRPDVQRQNELRERDRMAMYAGGGG